MKNISSIVITLVLVILSGTAIFQSTSNSDLAEEVLGALTQPEIPDDHYLVTKVVDGDTIKVNIDGDEQTVRLLSIDTPETVDPRKSVQCFGQQASDYLKSLLENQPVRLEYDSSQGQHDRYQRLLAYVFLEDNTFINAEMVSEGYAFAYQEIDSDELEYMIQLEHEARENNRGLWSECETEK